MIMELISAMELDQALKNGEPYLIVDVRELYEFEVCNLGTLHIPMGEITERYSELPKDSWLVIMCRSGKRAEAVAGFLISDFGFTKVFVLEGGILAWRDQVDSTLELD
jgi:adenylyltransferase/sulfurtransferase